MTLGEAGLLRAWFVEGPFVNTDNPPPSPQRDTEVHQDATGAMFETNENGVLDLDAQFGLHGTGSELAIAKGSLRVDSNVDGWLLLRTDGWLSATIDGNLRMRPNEAIGRVRGWQALPLSLKQGWHTVRLECRRLNDRWSLTARFVDRSGHAPPGATWQVPGAAPSSKRHLDPFNVSLDLSAEAPVGLRLKIDAPLGTPVPANSPLVISLRSGGGTLQKSLSVGTWPVASAPLTPLIVQVGLLNEWVEQSPIQDTALTLEVSAGAYRVLRRVNLSRELLGAWQAVARQLLALREPTPSELDIPRASLLSAMRDLSSAAVETRPAVEIRNAIAQAQWVSDALANARQLWTEPGIRDLAWRSSADASVQPFALQVPKISAADSRLPLVVVLHGYNGTPRSVLDAFLDTTPGQPPREVPGFILVPSAHGNAFYRGPGERDVLEILEWALRALPVDRNHVSITGVSMGGTGTAEIALHYPDKFAAFAPLCGYQSYYVRRDVSGQPIRAWERKLMHRNSAASSADSGRYLPMYLAHGLKDKPLENSRVLTTRYKALGYKLTEDWPNLGHSVWKKTWAHAGLFPWLSAQEQAIDPAKITLAATSLRHAQSYWLRVTSLDSQAELSTIDAEIAQSNTIRVVSRGVSAFAIVDTKRIDNNRPVQLQIDGIDVTAAPKSSLNFRRRDGLWIQGGVAAGPRKTLGAEGPWLDLWSEPLVFVYGTGSPETVGANREVARAFAAPQGTNDGAYPLVSDVEYLSGGHWDAVPILVGNSTDHALLAKWHNRLPWSTDSRSIRFGGREFKGEKLGALFVYPNPESPGRLIGVITAPTADGIWQSLSLPYLLPDFFVFDSRVAPASGEPILGRHGHVLAAGFFNEDWSLPNQLNDPLDEH